VQGPLWKNRRLQVEMPHHLIIRQVRNIFQNSSLERYFHKAAPNLEEWKDWHTLVAAARLAAEVPDEQDMLIGTVRVGIRRDRKDF
jgi:hypothetical protein